MHSFVPRPEYYAPLCSRCDDQSFRSLQTGRVEIHMLVTDGCEVCRCLIPRCLREYTRTVRTFRLEDDFFARLCIDYCTAADKSLNQSLTSEIRSEKDPLRRVAMMRLYLRHFHRFMFDSNCCRPDSIGTPFFSTEWVV